MGRYLVIGLGKFGTAVARSLEALGHEVIAIEREASLVDRLADCASRVIAGDATDIAVLRASGASDVDAAVISTGENLASTILSTVALRDLGVKHIYVKTASETEARALEALGVTQAIIPEQEAGARLAHRVASHALRSYMPIARGYCTAEVVLPASWRGKSLRQIDPRKAWKVSVIAVLDSATQSVALPPDPDAPLAASSSVLIAGSEEAVARLQEKA
jgi:trk system potassium uptake protein TrkA